ncbi:hypothetical protein [Desulfopila sp. IMCC35008]|uniref:hypothetical protein n=1 Tax=Desulfopila sp. IMCC35008 TaxID=2653858 RepID=UPI0013D25ABD|nr:hypothetical protein [Desulfopila sp. IMCC35008]
MNFYSIDYMIKERQKLELEESERKRMRRMAREQSSDAPSTKRFWRTLFPESTRLATVRK